MEVHLYSSIKAIVATDIVRYSDNTKRPKSKENQLGILKIYAFCQKCRGPQAQERALLGYVFMRMHRKSCRIFPLKVETTLLGVSRKGAIQRFTISVPVFILPISWRLLLRNGKISSKCLFCNERA